MIQLVQAIQARFPEVLLRGAFIDNQLSPSARSALAKFLRVAEDNVKALELGQQYPILPTEWILRPIHCELGSPDRFVERRARYAFCPVCIQEMSRKTQTVAAILAAIDGRQPNPRRDGQSCARAFTEKLRILTQHLTTPTDDPLPRFLRIARCRSALASLPFRTAASRDTNRDVVLVLALFANDNPCAPTQRRCLRFKYSSVHEFKSVSEPPVHELSAANECILRFKCSATAASSNSFSTCTRKALSTHKKVSFSLSGSTGN